MESNTPILDDHLHLDPEAGKGIDAVREFARSGGTHVLVVNKPSWHLGSVPEHEEDFRPGFETTVEIVERASEILDGRAWAVLGVHPGLVSRLIERGDTADDARELMCAGLDVAASYVEEGRALALKSGRPHYEVSEAVWDVSNAVLCHALALGAETDCAVQLHTEASDDLSEIAGWATEAGLAVHRVVKHYADGRLRGPTPSVIGRRESLTRAAETSEPFLMETDFLDDPDRPGAVLGPKTIPRRVEWLEEEGFHEAVRLAHVETPRRVYGIDTRETLTGSEASRTR